MTTTRLGGPSPVNGLSSITASVPIVVPNRREATKATAVARSASLPSLAIVADVRALKPAGHCLK